MGTLTSILSAYEDYHPVVPFNPVKERICEIDLSKNNDRLKPEIFKDIQAFSSYIQSYAAERNARYCIGGYGEEREAYAASTVFDAKESGKSPRRLHLGADIWGKPHTPVMAPLDGIVHSFGNNDSPGDYGGTILLSHQLGGISFFTLYGHLSLSSLKNLSKGQRVEKGEVIGEFGIPSENGQWPPHLHFQIIQDIGQHSGDYPGVCSKEDREYYLSNCPDPDLILGLQRFTQDLR